jgi:hypothetical protein
MCVPRWRMGAIIKALRWNAMADDDVDSLDDGQRWTGTAAGETPEESFPASGVVKPVVYAEVKTLPLPGAYSAVTAACVCCGAAAGHVQADPELTCAPHTPELRQHLRARGKNPAGGKANLVDRLQRALVEVRSSSVPPPKLGRFLTHWLYGELASCSHTLTHFH